MNSHGQICTRRWKISRAIELVGKLKVVVIRKEVADGAPQNNWSQPENS